MQWFQIFGTQGLPFTALSTADARVSSFPSSPPAPVIPRSLAAPMAEPPSESARRALRQTIRESTSVAINLASQEIGDAGAIEIARALADPPVDAKDPFNSNLQGLNLAHNEIGDVGVTALSTALTRYDKLKVLDLQDNKIGDVGAKV
jgi:hypothetical protein